VIQQIAFRIDRRLRRVQVFRLVIAKRAAAKRDDFSAFVRDGERDAPAEAVEQAATILFS